MNAIKTAQLSLTTLAVGMMFAAVAPKPGEAIIPVSVDLDTTALTIGAQQKLDMATQYLKQGLQYTKQLEQYQAQLQELKTIVGHTAGPNNLSKLTNEVIILNNQNPTTAGTNLANILVKSQNGSLSSSDLTDLQTEISQAAGNLQAQGANVDAQVTTAAAVKEQTELDASLENQRAADLNQARFHRPQVLDVSSGVPFNGGDGGFSATGIKDYGSSSTL